MKAIVAFKVTDSKAELSIGMTAMAVANYLMFNQV